MSDAGEKRSRFKVVIDFLKRLLGKKPAPPGDPYAYRDGSRASRAKRPQRRSRRRDRRRFLPEFPAAPLSVSIYRRPKAFISRRHLCGRAALRSASDVPRNYWLQPQ